MVHPWILAYQKTYRRGASDEKNSLDGIPTHLIYFVILRIPTPIQSHETHPVYPVVVYAEYSQTPPYRTGPSPLLHVSHLETPATKCPGSVGGGGT